MPLATNSWDRIKEAVKNEYPTITEGGEDFYKLVMSSYKEMNKFASGEEAIESLYKDKVISKVAYDQYKEEKQYLDIVRTVFSKDASWSSFGNTMKDMGEQAGAGLLIGGGLAAGAGLGKMLVKKIRGKKFDSERHERIKEIARFHPTIKEMDPQLLIQAMKDLEELNPSYAKSPLIAGSYLKSVYYGGGLTPEQANTVRNDKKVDDTRELILKGLSVRRGGKGIEKQSEEPKLSFGQNFVNHTKNTAIKSLVGGAAALGLAGAFAGGKAIYKNLSRNSRIEKIKEVHPELKKANVELYLKTVEKLNPTIASDPLAAGAYIKQLMKGVKTDTLHQLAETTDKHDRSHVFRSAGEAFLKG